MVSDSALNRGLCCCQTALHCTPTLSYDNACDENGSELATRVHSGSLAVLLRGPASESSAGSTRVAR